MEMPKPIIKFNGGTPVALCNRCFCMMCYVSCVENDGDYVVSEIRGVGDRDYISTPIGTVPPPFCDSCKDLLLNYSLNE